jgi:hypothetical protein
LGGLIKTVRGTERLLTNAILSGPALGNSWRPDWWHHNTALAAIHLVTTAINLMKALFI